MRKWQVSRAFFLQFVGQCLIIAQVILYWTQFLPDVALGTFRWDDKMWYSLAPFALLPLIDVFWIPKRLGMRRFAGFLSIFAYSVAVYVGGGWFVGSAVGIWGVVKHFRATPGELSFIRRREIASRVSILAGMVLASLFLNAYLVIPLPVGLAQFELLYPGQSSTPSHNNTFYILPIWENLGNMPQDLVEAENITQTLGPSGDYVKVGYSCSCWYVQEVTNWTGEWQYNASFSLWHKLNLSVQANLPILFHMNGGNWGASGLNPYAEVHTGRYRLYELWLNESNVQWNNYDKSVPVSWPRIEETLLWRMFTLSKYSQFYQLREQGCRGAAAIIAQFAQLYPALFVGVSLDSEIHLSYHNSSVDERNWRYDYNPLVIQEFQEWLAARYSTIEAFNTKFAGARGSSAVSFGSIDAPRTPDTSNIFWQEWTTFRVQFVQQNVDDQARWINEAGIPRDQIYTHQILSEEGETSAEDVRCDPLETTNIPHGSPGVTRYGFIPPARFHDINAIAKNNWGIFEFNLPNDHQYVKYMRMMKSMYEAGCHVVCPYAWYEGQDPELYQISNDTAFTTAIHDFVHVTKDFPRGTAPGGLLSAGDRVLLIQQTVQDFFDDHVYWLALPLVAGLALVILFRRKKINSPLAVSPSGSQTRP